MYLKYSLLVLSLAYSATLADPIDHTDHGHDDTGHRAQLNNGWQSYEGDMSHFSEILGEIEHEDLEAFCAEGVLTVEKLWQRGSQHSAQVNCGGEDIRHVLFEHTNDETSINCVNDKPINDIEMLSQAYIKNLLDQDVNLPILLANSNPPCVFEGEMAVGSSHFVQIESGVQHLIHVYDSAAPGNSEKECYLAIYDFSFPGTQPFCVTVPFHQQAHGLYFLNKIKEQFNSAGLNTDMDHE